MEKLIYINKNTKDLIEITNRRKLMKDSLTSVDPYMRRRHLEEIARMEKIKKDIDKKENRYYVVTDETKPDISECYDCFDDERLFTGVAKYYHWNNLPKREQDRWCSYCGCEGGCNLCESVNKIYNTLLVKYRHV